MEGVDILWNPNTRDIVLVNVEESPSKPAFYLEPAIISDLDAIEQSILITLDKSEFVEKLTGALEYELFEMAIEIQEELEEKHVEIDIGSVKVVVDHNRNIHVRAMSSDLDNKPIEIFFQSMG